MKNSKRIGIWMDHTEAHIIEFSLENLTTKVITCKSKSSSEDGASERKIHNKEQQITSSFYDDLAAEIKSCHSVLLFGPTQSKTELYNILRKDHHFDDVQIHIVSSDYITEHQEHAIVKKYFESKLNAG